MDGALRRLIVTGVDGDGRSVVVSVGPATITARLGNTDADEPPVDGDATIYDLWATAQPALLRSSEPERTPSGFDVGCPPGASRWFYVEMMRNRYVPLHQTATIDHHCILSGKVTLILENGEIELTAGDALVLPSVVHGWRTDDSGCVSLVMLVGTDAAQ
jgi:mannose-6-phosphate isomerase-like protein (cupin superfamily)